MTSLTNPNYDKRAHDYQVSVLERQPKNIQRLGDAASTNVGFRLENAGDALREIVSSIAAMAHSDPDRIARAKRGLEVN